MIKVNYAMATILLLESLVIFMAKIEITHIFNVLRYKNLINPFQKIDCFKLCTFSITFAERPHSRTIQTASRIMRMMRSTRAIIAKKVMP